MSFIGGNKLNNYVTDVYCTGTKNLFRTINHIDGALLNAKDFYSVGAVNLVLNYSTFSKTLFFDERFGVNAQYGAGEDGDYFLRALKFENFYYSNKLFSFHPSADSKYKSLTYKQLRSRLRNYARGCIALLCKHKMYWAALKLTFRALGGSVLYLLKLQFSTALAYFEAFFVRLNCLIKYSFSSFN
ncbi:hypothetical protein D3C80_1222910 [compost metagenome]